MNLEETIRQQTDALNVARSLGRAQMARDVLAWAAQNANALKGAPVESLLALCNKEIPHATGHQPLSDFGRPDHDQDLTGRRLRPGT